MKTKMTFLLLTILLSFPVQIRAAELEFHEDEYGLIDIPQDWYDVAIYDSATVDMVGGTVHILDAYNSSTFNMSNGSITLLLHFMDSSTANINGGEIARLTTAGSSTANIYGGSYEYYISAHDQSVVNIYGYDFNYDNGYLSGYWPDNSPFNILLRGPDTYPRVVLHTIPEPSSILTILLGSSVISRRRKISQSKNDR